MGSQDQHREVVVAQQQQPKNWDQLYPTQRLSRAVRGYSPASGNYARPADQQSVHGTQQGDANLTDEQG